MMAVVGDAARAHVCPQKSDLIIDSGRVAMPLHDVCGASGAVGGTAIVGMRQRRRAAAGVFISCTRATSKVISDLGMPSWVQNRKLLCSELQLSVNRKPPIIGLLSTLCARDVWPFDRIWLQAWIRHPTLRKERGLHGKHPRIQRYLRRAARSQLQSQDKIQNLK